VEKIQTPILGFAFVEGFGTLIIRDFKVPNSFRQGRENRQKGPTFPLPMTNLPLMVGAKTFNTLFGRKLP